MGQNIFHIDATSTGNLVQGRSIIKTSGKFDTQGIQTGFNDGPRATGIDIASITGLYQTRFDDTTYYD